MSRPSLLHLNGKRKNIQCARAEQNFGHVTEILRCHVVDICFDHDNVFSRSTAFCTEHKADTVGKIRKLLRAGAVTYTVGHKVLEGSKPVDDRSEYGRTRRSYQLRVCVFRIN